jgi:protein-tyrosine phosphatase
MEQAEKRALRSMEKSSRVMQGYTDIHCHILPGVDDGSQNIEESMGMLRIAYENQIRRIIVTPHNKPMHHNADQDKIKELITELAAKMKQEDISILLYPGNELYYCNELVEKLEAQKACTMAESSYVLVEFAPVDSWEYIRNGINNLIMGGYIPILAHVERYKEMCASTERTEELIEMGAYIQVNASSIMGKYGFGTRHFTRTLLKNKLVHFVATDAHNCENRSPDLDRCAQWIEKKYGRPYARKLLWENASRVIEGEYI